MHDSTASKLTGSRILPVLIAALFLVSMPLLFRKPSSTMTHAREIAIHASVLSMSDSAWSGNRWFFTLIDAPPPGEVAFGIHDVYPYRFFTARDIASGDILISIDSPIRIPSRPDSPLEENLQLSAISRGEYTLLLVHHKNSESWPAALFSIITNG